MSADNFTSPAGSTGSSIPVGAEATKYHKSHSYRPASSRKLFGGNNGDSRNCSEVDVGVHELHQDVGDHDDSNDDVGASGDRSVMTSERLAAQVDKMLCKLTQDMDRVSRIYGDKNLFVHTSESFEAELHELNKLNEADARDQLERYALRCHVSEREKEQLHRRNHELHNAIEILRTQVIRGQRNTVEQIQVLLGQAIDALRDLEQSSAAEVTKWKQKHALSLAQSNTFQNQLKQTAAQLEAKKEEAKEANKQLDMLRFERDSLRNHSDQIEQQLDQADSALHDLVAQMKKKDEDLQAKCIEANSKDSEIRELKEKLKKLESAVETHVKRREEEITKQMDLYLQETKLIDAERERLARLKILEAQERLKLMEEERDGAERRAKAAEEKVADYEANFVRYRGQMEGEALRAITNGYRNALSAIPSARRDVCSGLNDLLPLMRSSSCNENNDPPADPGDKSLSARYPRTRLPSVPSRLETLSARSGLPNQRKRSTK